jgi:hypothetical protein
MTTIKKESFFWGVEQYAGFEPCEAVDKKFKKLINKLNTKKVKG